MLYKCDPAKNTECKKTFCYLNGGECYQTTRKEYCMENEIRYYLKQVKDAMTEKTKEQFIDQLRSQYHGNEEEFEAMIAHGVELPPVFKPQYIVTAVKLPTGAIEIAVNHDKIAEKIDYILNAYDEDMRLKTNTDIVMSNIMIV